MSKRVQKLYSWQKDFPDPTPQICETCQRKVDEVNGFIWFQHDDGRQWCLDCFYISNSACDQSIPTDQNYERRLL